MSADVEGRAFPRCDLHADDLVLSARAANTNGGVLLRGINMRAPFLGFSPLHYRRWMESPDCKDGGGPSLTVNCQ